MYTRIRRRKQPTTSIFNLMIKENRSGTQGKYSTVGHLTYGRTCTVCIKYRIVPPYCMNTVFNENRSVTVQYRIRSTHGYIPVPSQNKSHHRTHHSEHSIQSCACYHYRICIYLVLAKDALDNWIFAMRVQDLFSALVHAKLVYKHAHKEQQKLISIVRILIYESTYFRIG